MEHFSSTYHLPVAPKQPEFESSIDISAWISQQAVQLPNNEQDVATFSRSPLCAPKTQQVQQRARVRPDYRSSCWCDCSHHPTRPLSFMEGNTRDLSEQSSVLPDLIYSNDFALETTSTLDTPDSADTRYNFTSYDAEDRIQPQFYHRVPVIGSDQDYSMPFGTVTSDDGSLHSAPMVHRRHIRRPWTSQDMPYPAMNQMRTIIPTSASDYMMNDNFSIDGSHLGDRVSSPRPRLQRRWTEAVQHVRRPHPHRARSSTFVHPMPSTTDDPLFLAHELVPHEFDATNAIPAMDSGSLPKNTSPTSEFTPDHRPKRSGSDPSSAGPSSTSGGLDAGTSKSSGPQLWTLEEDESLKTLVEPYTAQYDFDSLPWHEIHSYFPHGRTLQQIKVRWMESLQPGLRKGKWVAEEDEQLELAYNQFGGRWAKVAEQIDGRTQRQCRTRWLAISRRRTKE